MVKLNSNNPLKRPGNISSTLIVAAAMLLSTGGGLVLSQRQEQAAGQQPSVLAYATALTSDGMLEATNANRLNNHQEPLYINPKLTEAAQAKAKDMAARNYWSHNTPQGRAPWDFIKPTGYSFSDAGENLAYGYANNDAVIKGWMNSPGHRANILNDRYQEVGFGYANAPSYQGDGQQTIVVAMYARPTGKFVSPPPAPKMATAAATDTSHRALKRKPVTAEQPPARPTPQPTTQPKPQPATKPAAKPTDTSPGKPAPQPITKPSSNKPTNLPAKVVVTPQPATVEQTPVSLEKKQPESSQPTTQTQPTVNKAAPTSSEAQPQAVTSKRYTVRFVRYFFYFVDFLR